MCGSGRDRDKVLDEIGTRGERDDSNEVRRQGSKARATMETRVEGESDDGDEDDDRDEIRGATR